MSRRGKTVTTNCGRGELFHLLKTERDPEEDLHKRADARQDVFEYIEMFL